MTAWGLEPALGKAKAVVRVLALGMKKVLARVKAWEPATVQATAVAKGNWKDLASVPGSGSATAALKAPTWDLALALELGSGTAKAWARAWGSKKAMAKGLETAEALEGPSALLWGAVLATA